MNKDLNPTEEHALDALLLEALGDAPPPDQTAKILARCHDVSEVVSSRAPKVVTSSGDRDRSKSSGWILLASAAVLAASLLIAFGWRSFRVAPDSIGAVAGGGKDPVAASSNEPNDLGLATSESVPVQKVPREQKPPRGIPLMVADRDSSNRDPKLQPENGPVLSQPQPAELTLVSKQVNSDFHAYWQAIGIKPSGDAPAETVVERLAMILGVELAESSLDDVAQLHDQLSSPAHANVIALNWLQQISEGGVANVKKDARAALVAELAACFQTNKRFDRVLAELVAGESPHSSTFYRAISVGSDQGNASVVRRLAALTMNVDLRCTRCHDSYIEGSGLQHDYWAFTALLRRGLSTGKGKSDPFFYELPDGRERLVEPLVAEAWINSDQPITNLRQWAERLEGSTELATGVVNSLWQLVHGQPLRGRVVDPISAPHNESLSRLEDQLAQDLIQSEFNVARTLSLIIASPTARQTIPPALLPENAFVADEADRRSALDAVNAFAASMPVPTQLSQAARLVEVSRAIGSHLQVQGDSLVGQADTSSANSASSQKSTNSLSVDLPSRADTLPVQWLGQIRDERIQIEHLGHLAGAGQLSSQVFDTAEQMRNAGVSEELCLQRVWWLIRR
ncbi:MAG: hypothetical protein AB8B91_00255 [Rubripirellula sp.]